VETVEIIRRAVAAKQVA